MSDLPPAPPAPSAGVSRRTVVRTAGAAAWTAPVIVVATAVPAVAASAVNLDIVNMTGGRSTAIVSPYLQLQVQNNAPVARTGALTVSITVNSPTGNASAPSVSPISGAGWTQGTVTETATGFTATYSRVSETLQPGTTTPILRIIFTSSDAATVPAQTAGSGQATVVTPTSPKNNTATASYPAA